MVLMKGLRQGSLYFLQGTRVRGRAAVCTIGDVDRTRLWHMRFGHMRKKGYLARAGTGKLSFCDHSVFGKERGHTFFKSKAS